MSDGPCSRHGTASVAEDWSGIAMAEDRRAIRLVMPNSEAMTLSQLGMGGLLSPRDHLRNPTLIASLWLMGSVEWGLGSSLDGSLTDLG